MNTHGHPGRVLAQLLVMALVAGLLALLPATRADATHGPTVRISDAYTGSSQAIGTPCPCDEGDSGTTTFRFDVTLTETLSPRSATVEVDYVTANGEATVADDDYVAAEGTLSFPPGVSSRTVDVVVNGDTAVEADEAFLVVLTDVGPDAHVGDDTGRGVIADDDATGELPTFSVADTSAGEQAGVMAFTVSLVRPAGTEGTTYEVDIATSDGTATASALPPVLMDDYDAASTTLTFVAGDTSETFEVTVNQDAVYEGDETLFATLSGNDEGTSIDRGRATGTILEDESVPAVSIGDASDAENADDDLEFTVSMTPEAAFEVTVDWATQDQTATLADDDYAAASGTVTFAPGDTSETVTVDQTGDANVEGNEVVAVVLSDPAPEATIGDGTGAGTITNDDTGDRTLAILDGSVGEGDTGTRPLTFTLQLNGYSDQAITVDFDTLAVSSASGASPSAPGQDYASVTDREITIPAGTRSVTTPVQVLGDTRDEADEIFLGRIALQGGPATITDGTGTGTIADDDPGIHVDDATVTEGDEGERTLRFRIRTSSAPAEDDLTVEYTTADGSASAGSDYDETAGTATVPVGATSTTVDVPVRGDTVDEVDETLTLRLSDPSDGAIEDAVGVGTILDDDAALPTVDAGSDRTLDTQEAGTFRATVTGGDGDATVTWDFGDGSSTRTGSTVTHRYTRTGSFEVTVTADDSAGSDSDRLTVTVVDTGVVRRLAGEDRVATSVAVARAHWTSAPTVLLATSQNFPDALAASALAGVDDAPVVLTPPDAAPDQVLDLLEDLDTTRVRILGGPAAVSDDVADQLRDAGVQVTRVEGPDRFATAAAVARIVGAPSGRAVVALGDHAVPSRAWPDALSAGSYAAGPIRMPVLLTRSDQVPAATLEALRDLGVGNVDLLGGPVAISDEVAAQLERAGVRVTRVAGDTRYGTSVAVAERVLRTLPAGTVPLVFATGEAFPDGLAGGGLAARTGAPIVLVRPDGVPAEVAALLAEHRDRFDDADLLGGSQAIADPVRAELADRMGG